MCKCWTDFLPAYAALKAAAASDPAVAAQFASVADMDSQMPGICSNPESAGVDVMYQLGLKAASNDVAASCKCWSDFSSTYATLSASKDPKDVNEVALLAPMVPDIQKACLSSTQAATKAASNGVSVSPSLLLVLLLVALAVFCIAASSPYNPVEAPVSSCHCPAGAQRPANIANG